MLDSTAPIVVGATGGSGTRVVRELLIRAGVHMGTYVNAPGDALAFMPFMQGVSNWALQHTRSADYDLSQLPAWLREEGLLLLDTCVQRHRADVPPESALWGWKVPTILYVLPFVQGCCPEFRLIHVIRDGRDIAFSKNQRQVQKYYGAMFDSWQEYPMCVPSGRLWSRMNREVRQWGQRQLADRYLLIRFEDLCADPIKVGSRVLEFVGSHASPAEACSHIQRSQSIGRWRKNDRELVKEVQRVAREGLETFGYIGA